jgi:hypothetical protein
MPGRQPQLSPENGALEVRNGDTAVSIIGQA